MPNRNKCKLLILLAMLVVILGGCGPEGGRERGAGFGTGADPGNHGDTPQEVAPRSKVFAGESKP